MRNINAHGTSSESAQVSARKLSAGVELIRIRGHLTLWEGGIHHAE